MFLFILVLPLLIHVLLCGGLFYYRYLEFEKERKKVNSEEYLSRKHVVITVSKSHSTCDDDDDNDPQWMAMNAMLIDVTLNVHFKREQALVLVNNSANIIAKWEEKTKLLLQPVMSINLMN